MFMDLLLPLIYAFAFILQPLAISFAVVYFLFSRRGWKRKLSKKHLLLSFMISWACSALTVVFIGAKNINNIYFFLVPLSISSIVLFAIYSKTKKEYVKRTNEDELRMSAIKKQRVGIVVSAVWAVLTMGIAVLESDITIFLFLCMIPLIIGWGIWWVRKAKPNRNRR